MGEHHRQSVLLRSVTMSIGSPLELHDVHSTHLHTIRYEPARLSLWVRFRDAASAPASGHWYEYLDVARHHFDALALQAAGAERERHRRHPKGQKPFSVGTYFHTNIEPYHRHRSHAGALS